MRIVTTDSHPSYLSLLSGLSHDFTVVALHGRGPDRRGRDLLATWPPNLHPVELEEASRGARKTPFDLALAHSVNDILVLQEICPRQIMICHRTLAGQVEAEGSNLRLAEYSERVAHFLNRLQAKVVFTSKAVADSWWGLSGRVIAPGIPAAALGGYTGREPAVLWVSSQGVEPGAPPGRDLQQEALHGIPKTVIHRNLGAAGAWSPTVESVADRILRPDAFRHYRCLFVSYRSEGENGFDLELLEAMATGMPVVTTPHTISPVRHGVSGLVGGTALELRRHLVRLLHQPELAQRLGANARQTVTAAFPYDTFLSAWDGGITSREGTVAAIDMHPHRSNFITRPDLSLIEGVLGSCPGLAAPFDPPRLTLIEGGRLS